MTDIRRIEAGPRMSEAVIHGEKLYTAGVVASSMVGSSVFEQTKDILQQIDALLAQAGTDKTRILKANIWLTDITTFDQMNKAWDAWVVAGKAPARATVESKLAATGYDVEIMVEAAVYRWPISILARQDISIVSTRVFLTVGLRFIILISYSLKK